MWPQRSQVHLYRERQAHDFITHRRSPARAAEVKEAIHRDTTRENRLTASKGSHTLNNNETRCFRDTMIRIQCDGANCTLEGMPGPAAIRFERDVATVAPWARLWRPDISHTVRGVGNAGGTAG